MEDKQVVELLHSADLVSVERSSQGRKNRIIDGLLLEKPKKISPKVEENFTSAKNVGLLYPVVKVFNPESVDGRIISAAFGAKNDGVYPGEYGGKKYLLVKEKGMLKLYPEIMTMKEDGSMSFLLQENMQRFLELMGLYQDFRDQVAAELGNSQLTLIRNDLEIVQSNVVGDLDKMTRLVSGTAPDDVKDYDYDMYSAKLISLHDRFEQLMILR